MTAYVTTAIAPSLPGFLGRIQDALRFGSRIRLAPPVKEDTLSRREFILEMMNAHPDAFSSDADVYAMRSLFPDRF